jgi:hypothetical protein
MSRITALLAFNQEVSETMATLRKTAAKPSQTVWVRLLADDPLGDEPPPVAGPLLVHGTVWDRLYLYLWEHPGITAADIAKAIHAKLNTVSSELKKGSDEGSLLRTPGGGPRGGYTYEINPNYDPHAYDRELGII